MQLRETVMRMLATSIAAPGAAQPRALIVPHAGYIYSGASAAAAYACLASWRTTIRRVVLAGPAHRVAVRGVALSAAAAFATPLGNVALDQQVGVALYDGHLEHDDAAHAPEHALEVQLPFLQVLLPSFQLVPMLIGTPDPGMVADMFEPWWDAPDTLIVVSTDLSHYLDYARAVRRDAATDSAIMGLDSHALGPHDACGCRPLNGLLDLARRRGATVSRRALCNSGDTAGTRERVVGYGAYLIS
jgi:AmmeMemoRadiSam system protein B